MNPIINVAEIKKKLKKLILIDCRFDLMDSKKGKSDYLKGHIPGSFFLDVENNLCSKDSPITHGRHPLPSKIYFRNCLNNFGAKIERGIKVFQFLC